MLTPKIFVTTYKKYNAGRGLVGKFIEIDGLSKEEITYAMKAAHSDELDPEFMITASEDVPESLVNESYVSDELIAYANASDEDRQLLMDIEGANEYAKERISAVLDGDYIEFDSKFELVKQLWIEPKGEAIPDDVVDYLDINGIYRDLEINGDFVVISEDARILVF